MEKSGYVYVSYRSDARQLVLKLANDLRAHGVDPWLPSERLKPGDNLASVGDALGGAAAVILVLSRIALESEFFRHEYIAAMRAQKKIIPLRIDGNLEFPMFLESVVWIDFGYGGCEKGLRQLIDGLGNLVKADQPVEKPARMAKGYMFLSYSEENREFAEKVKDFLADLGYAFWDYADSDRDYSSQLYQELERVIRDAKATICILSPSWRRSKWTIKEYLYSEDVGTPVILLRAEQMEPTLITAGIPYIDMVPDEKAGFERLARELRRKGL